MKHSLTFFEQIKVELRIIEELIEKHLKAVRGRLGNASLETLQAGGKRLRPALVLICGKVGSYDTEHLLPVAAAVELVHMASLVHDDVLDEAELRRGLPSINYSFGHGTAVATGDLLFALAFILLAQVGKAEIVRIMSETAVSLSQGELEQMRTIRNLAQTIGDYLKKIECKTASLFSAACRMGAIVSGAGRKEAKALAGYGRDLGIAFQIYDDVLDFTGTEKLLGKPVGTDLREGTVTMPMLFALEESPQSEPLAELIEAEDLSEDQVRQAIDWVLATGALERAKKEARKYVEKAIQSIDVIGHHEVREELTALGEFVIERCH